MAAAPHVRGEVRIRFATTICGGITPAWAGRRNGVVAAIWRIRDHPRVRGEKSLLAFSTAFEAGSPPRARGEGTPRHFQTPAAGITPACAGRRLRRIKLHRFHEDHPRVRGEKAASDGKSCISEGSPPRARGEGFAYIEKTSATGITPACAGRSLKQFVALFQHGDHPRVRGEKRLRLFFHALEIGSPPRARGEAGADRAESHPERITPACAERRVIVSSYMPPAWDHPRVRGEKLTFHFLTIGVLGSPPRARGEDRTPMAHRSQTRITPACAGRRYHSE